MFYKTSKILVICLATLLLAFNFANASSLFKIEGIKIESSGTSASSAREAGIKQAEREAFLSLVEKVSTSQMSEADLTKNQAAISAMVSSMDIVSEEVTPKHYRAVVDISFNGKMVDKFLKDRSIETLSRKQNPTLVIPVVYNKDGSVASSNSEWIAALNNIVKSKSGLVDIKIVAFSFNNNDTDQSRLQDLLSQYSADELVFANLQLFEDAKRMQLDAGSLKGSFSIATKEYNNIDLAASNLIEAIEGAWKSNSSPIQLETKKEVFYVPIASLGQWIEMRQKLEATPKINKVIVKEMAVDHAIIELIFSGELNDLVSDLQYNGIGITNSNGRNELSLNNSSYGIAR